MNKDSRLERTEVLAIKRADLVLHTFHNIDVRCENYLFYIYPFGNEFNDGSERRRRERNQREDAGLRNVIQIARGRGLDWASRRELTNGGRASEG